jgi:hypothetical protein
MLRLGAFTRKRLAEKSGEDLGYIHPVVSKFGRWLRTDQIVRSGRPGPPEEMLSLTAEGEKAILAELTPLYEEMKPDVPEVVDLATYIPSPKQYGVVRELIEEIENKRSATAARLRRVITLLADISEQEKLKPEEILGQFDSRISDMAIEQQVAQAKIDLLKGKLCWLFLEVTDAPDTASPQFFVGDPGKLGLTYLQSAARVFQQYSTRDVAEIDLWTTKHVHAVLFETLTEQPDDALERLREQVDPSVLPGVHKFIETIAQPEPSEILDGLLQYYHRYCTFPTERAVALLDIRRRLLTFAIVERNGPFTAQSVPFSGESKDNEKLLIDVVHKSMWNYQQSHGSRAIERIFVTGEPVCMKKFNTLAAEVIDEAVRIGDFCRPNQKGYPLMALSDKPMASGEFSRAAEVGLTLKAAKFLA